MIQFVQPIWILTLAGIAVPLIIHLWNVKKGKTLKVGNVAFLTRKAKTHARSLRISDLLLLLIRILLLSLLTLLCLEPFLRREDHSLKQARWILARRAQLKEAHAAYGNTIDSLAKQGYTIHYFEKGFPEGAIADSNKNIVDTGSVTPYWTLIKQLDQQVPASMPVYLFTDNRLANLEEERPSVLLNLQWKTFPLATIAKKESQQIDTNRITTFIYSDKQTADVNYLKAALEAIRDRRQKNINISVTGNSQQIPAHFNWLFWLSEKPVPATFLHDNVFVYATGKQQNHHSLIVPASMQNGEVSGYKFIIPEKTPTADPLWTSGEGNAVLTKNIKDPQTTIYRFYSRFDPQWSDLVWSEQFPQLIYTLIAGEPVAIPKTTIIDPQQVQPVKDATDKGIKQLLARTTDIVPLIWLLVFIVFVIERLMTFSRKKEVANA